MYGAQELSRCQRYWAARFADRFLGHYFWIWWGLWLRWLSQARSTQGRADWIRSLHWYCRHQNYIAKHKPVGADASSANWRISNAWSRTTCRRLLCLFIWKMIAKLIACELGLAGQSVYAIGNPFGLDHSMTLYWNEITIDDLRHPVTLRCYDHLLQLEREREKHETTARDKHGFKVREQIYDLSLSRLSVPNMLKPWQQMLRSKGIISGKSRTLDIGERCERCCDMVSRGGVLRWNTSPPALAGVWRVLLFSRHSRHGCLARNVCGLSPNFFFFQTWSWQADSRVHPNWCFNQSRSTAVRWRCLCHGNRTLPLWSHMKRHEDTGS